MQYSPKAFVNLIQVTSWGKSK